MKTRLLKKLRAEARKQIYIMSCFNGVGELPFYKVVNDPNHIEYETQRDNPSMQAAYVIMVKWRRQYIESQVYMRRAVKQQKRDTKRLNL